MRLYTIGFGRKSAREFFTGLSEASVRCVLDVRHDRDGHAPSHARRDNLMYFLQAIGGIDYQERPDLAPSPRMFYDYRKLGGDWRTFEIQFLKQLARQRVETSLSPQYMADACLLCFEDRPERCHRRLVAEYLRQAWGGVDIVHL